MRLGCAASKPMTALRPFAFLIVAAGLLIGGGLGAAAPADSLDEKLKSAVSRGDVPGIVVMAATADGRVLYEGAFGKADVARDRAMTMDTLFRIASMTKPVTSVAALQLYEQRRFALDDPAEKYLPELEDLKVFETFDPKTGTYTLRPAKKKVTIRQLFTHTSGLGYGFTSATLHAFKPREGEEYVGPLLFEPGTQWIYGTSTDWLGRLVERLSGKNLEEYFRENIFAPLGMPDTFYNVPQGKEGRRVTAHRREGGRADAPPVERPNQPPTASTSFNGGGGLWSTASDYMRFERMILNRGSLDGVRILSADSVSLMMKNQIDGVRVRALKTAQADLSMDFAFIDDAKDKWSLGFLLTTASVPGKRAASSLSWGGLSNTYFWIDPKRRVAGVVLMQLLPFADTKALAIYDTFERGVYQLLRAD
jgi:CubicO group peptidase (beta-lactamase class C family)